MVHAHTKEIEAVLRKCKFENRIGLHWQARLSNWKEISICTCPLGFRASVYKRARAKIKCKLDDRGLVWFVNKLRKSNAGSTQIGPSLPVRAQPQSHTLNADAVVGDSKSDSSLVRRGGADDLSPVAAEPLIFDPSRSSFFDSRWLKNQMTHTVVIAGKMMIGHIFRRPAAPCCTGSCGNAT